MGACRQSHSCRFSRVAASVRLILLALLATIASSAPVSIVPGAVVSFSVASTTSTSASASASAIGIVATSAVLPLDSNDGAGTYICQPETCGPASGDVVTCHPVSAEVADCATITTAINAQHTIYCGQQLVAETILYKNLVTAGSMFLPLSPISSYSQKSPAITAVPPSTKTLAAENAFPSNVASEPPGSGDITTVAIVFVVFGSALLISALLYCVFRSKIRSWVSLVRNCVAVNVLRHRRGIADSSIPTPNAANTEAARGRANISTTNAMNPEDYLSPIARERMARQTEARDAHLEELSYIRPRSVLKTAESQIEGAWAGKDFRSNRSANPSSRWSAGNAPTTFQQRQYNRERRLKSLNDMTAGQIANNSVRDRPYESDDSLIISPNPRIGLDLPLDVGVNPLIGSEDRASGKAPVRKGSITHCTPTKIRQSWARARCESPLFGQPGTTVSTGGGLPYKSSTKPTSSDTTSITPGAALANVDTSGPATDGVEKTTTENAGIEESTHIDDGHVEAAQDEISHNEISSPGESAEGEPVDLTEVSNADSTSYEESAAHDYETFHES